MNIAFLFFGEFRWFDSFKSTFEKNFKPALKGHNVHYFAHFWNKDLEKLEEFNNLCSPLITEIEIEKTYDELKTFFNNKKNLYGTMTFQSYSFHKSFLLLEKFQQQNNMQFDIYIKLRVDLAFLQPINFNDFDSKSVYFKNHGPSRPLNSFLNDYIFFTKNYDALQEISKIGFHFDEVLKNPHIFIHEVCIERDIFIPEEMLARYVASKNISTKNYKFNIDLARYHTLTHNVIKY